MVAGKYNQAIQEMFPDLEALMVKPMTSDRKITIQDVAARAGVSISSVSRALGGHPHVSQTLRDRVGSAARELGYQPDFKAFSLRTGSTQSIGFLIGNLSNPVVADISDSAANVLAAQNYAMALVCSQNNPDLDVSYLRFLAQRQVDGLIVSSATRDGERANEVIRELGIPTVMLDRRAPEGEHISSVQSDHAAGMRAAVAHLIQQGHRRIAFIGGPETFDPVRDRLAGFREGMLQAQVPIDRRLVQTTGIDATTGYVETMLLLTRAERPTALIAAGNTTLIGAVQAIQERGVQIGRDLALIGCDDIDLTRLYNPPITVISRDLRLLGETAARLLLDKINRGQRQTIVLPTRLVVRESSLCAPLL
jgi:LacI family transcriptional regulator